MAVKRMTVSMIEIEDRPGALQEVLAGAAVSETSIVQMAGFSVGGGKGAAFLVPDRPDALKDYAVSRGLAVKEYPGFLLNGADRIGLGSDVTRPLADAGINIVFSTATVVEGEYHLLIAVRPSDEDAAAEALGA
jgi:hypothetical protein